MTLKEALHILKLNGNPSLKDVKKAYHALARLYHPDLNPLNPDAGRLFRQCSEAYTFLIENREAWLVPDRTATAEAEEEEDFSDIFDDILGFSRGSRILGYQEPQRVALTVGEFAFGVTKKLKLIAYEKCGDCRGIGSSGKTPVIICTYCFGAGRIKTEVANEPVEKTCPRCEGKGRKVAIPCPVCVGYGRLKRQRLQMITIPPGFLPGKTYTLKSTDIKTGDIFDVFLHLSFRDNYPFQVEKGDILCDYPIDSDVAAAGAMIDFPGVWGWLKLTIPRGTTEGRILRLNNQGLVLKPGGGQRSHLLVRVSVPPGGSKAGQRLFFRQISLGNPAYARKKGSWVSRLTSWLSSS